MDSLFAESKASAVMLGCARTEARDVSIQAIRTLEARLTESLGNERLRGLPNLGTREAPFYAERLVPSRASQSKLPPDGREVLAIGTDGKLVVVWAFRGKIEARPVLDEELVLEDLERFVKVVSELLERFVALSERRTEKIERAGRLAKKLLEIVGEEV